MTCASCGKQIPTGARYCIHCGAEQSVPTPIAAVTAAAGGPAREPRAQAANAAQAEPGSSPITRQAANQPSATAAPGEGRSETRPQAIPPAPAHAGLPRHTGLAAAVLAACVVAAIAGFFAWRMQADRSIMEHAPESPDAVAQPVAPPASDTTARGADAASGAAQDAAPAPDAEAPGEAGGTAPAGAAAPAEPRPAPVEIRPLPARPAPARASRHAVAEKGAPPAPVTPLQPAVTPALPAAAPAPARAAPPADRWTRMEDELSRCTREDFITRVICGQRVRFRYCDGYWGKAPQCPASAPPAERGQ